MIQSSCEKWPEGQEGPADVRSRSGRNQGCGLNTITPVLVCNVDDFASLNGHTGNAVTNDDVVIELSK